MINVSLPDSITTINNDAFISTLIQYIYIPKSVTTIDDYNPFDLTPSIEYINVSEDSLSFKSIDGVLFNKNLTILMFYPRAKKGFRYVIPSGVVELYFGCFNANAHLQELIIPESAKIVRLRAFVDNVVLRKVIVLRTLNSSELTFEKEAFLRAKIQQKDFQYLMLSEYISILMKPKTMFCNCMLGISTKYLYVFILI